MATEGKGERQQINKRLYNTTDSQGGMKGRKSVYIIIYICDLLREKGDFHAKSIYELRSKIVEYAPPSDYLL